MNVSVRSLAMKIGILLSYLLMIAVNALANILPINGVNTGEASARYDTLFTPAAYTFGIWGLIYLLLGVYVLFQFLPAKGEENGGRPEKVGWMFILSSLFNAGWIFAWHYNQIALSVALMLLILLTLMRAAWVLREPHCSPKEELALRVPFGIYFGWITVATIANISVWLVSLSWNGFGLSPAVWTVIILCVGAAIIGVTMWRIRSVAYGLTALWAYTGILVRHLTERGGQYPLIVAIAAVALAALAVLTVISGVHMRRVTACTLED